VGGFETNADGSRRALKSYALKAPEWEALMTTMNRAFPKSSSEPPVQTLDAKSKALFIAGITKAFGK
jgi:hypothetical protein